MASYDQFTFSDVLIRQSQNTARLAFEVQFRALKRRLTTEVNEQKTAYNNMDKTLEPVLADFKQQRVKVEKERADLTNYLEVGRRNVKKLSTIIDKLVPQLNAAASEVGPEAAEKFNNIRDQLNKALKNLEPNSYLEAGFLDKVKKFRYSKNPSGIGNYDTYASIPARAEAVGNFVSAAEDPLEVNGRSSRGLGRALGLLRYNLVQDFNLAKSKQEAVTEKLKDIDKTIEQVDATERLKVLKQIQALEKNNERILRNLSLSFEFSQANLETFADRNRFLRPRKGSIVNIFG